MTNIVNNFTVIMTCFGFFFCPYSIIMPTLNFAKAYRMTDKAIKSGLIFLIIGIVFFFIVKFYANGTILQCVNANEWLIKPVVLTGNSLLGVLFGPALLAIVVSPLFEKLIFKD